MKTGVKLAVAAVAAVATGVGVRFKQLLILPEEKELRISRKEQLKDVKLQIKNKDITVSGGKKKIIDINEQFKQNLIELKKSDQDSDQDSHSE